METAKLKKFAQYARRSLMEQINQKLQRVLAIDSFARRERSSAIKNLEQAIAYYGGQDQLIEKVVYTWFNRFCALRFMDVNRYNSIGILSPSEGQFQPEILAEAKKGYIDLEIVPGKTADQIHGLLSGNIPSKEPQNEAYGLLIISVCNYYHSIMPFLFESINDYTELLLPDDLLSNSSIIVYTREALTPETCQDIEVIGWLYQFFISEKKDLVFENLKKNKKISPENIPAATQLFTPHWIVRYLVENSLGRLWMLNHPNSNLISQMEYYVKPEVPETEFLKIISPEEIKICDPACGSGHMLVYAFDLLYAIYEEEGYDTSEIPAKILTNNLFGIEIDERAGELAAFALVMKARSRQRRFFSQQIKPNICVLENVKFEPGELKDYMNFVGRDLFTKKLQNTLQQFEEADNFGSLIRPDLTDVESIIQILNSKNNGSDLFLNKTYLKVMRVLEQAEYLRDKYHVVVANPPYMGGSGMNGRLSTWVKDNYPDSKADLFAIFIERNLVLARKTGMIAMITMQSWMFLSSFEKIRTKLIDQGTILSMAHLGARAFDSIGGEVVSTTAFIVQNQFIPGFWGSFIRLIDDENEESKDRKIIEAIKKHDCGWYYRAKAENFMKIPRSPIAYWVSSNTISIFSNKSIDNNCSTITKGIFTGNNNRFLRLWYEVSVGNKNWQRYNKAGGYRKWYGLSSHVIDWSNDGRELKNFSGAGLGAIKYFGKPHIVWSGLTSGNPSFRDDENNVWFDDVSPAIVDSELDKNILCFLNSSIACYILKILNPTLHYQISDIKLLPYLVSNANLENIKLTCIEISKQDWDSYEISWNFLDNPLIKQGSLNGSIKRAYFEQRNNWRYLTNKIKDLEESNNLIFINDLGLRDEVNKFKHLIDLSEITLTCNPYYRYGGNKSEAELESLLLADTIREFISYAVGCMFGRYSLDKPSLILANQGETIADYLQQIPSPTFMPDEDNVIPILDGEWFTDDIVERFRAFLQVTFGKENFQENLRFIEDAIGKDIRNFFLKDFYSDHVKRYKKRPIYWLFSSPKGTFNALIYMHRYRPDTVSVILNKYLREFKVKLSARMEHLRRVETSANASKAEKTRALKDIEVLKKNLDELETWERDVIYPLALEQKEIDLDDGVKANYPKFGASLKKIAGLEAEED